MGAAILSSSRTAASRSCSTSPSPFRAVARRRKAIAVGGRLAGRQVGLEKIGEIQQRSHADHRLGRQGQLAGSRRQHPGGNLQAIAPWIEDGERALPALRCAHDLERKAVERMGGRVGVESALGQGSRFWMELQNAGGPR